LLLNICCTFWYKEPHYRTCAHNFFFILYIT
jgi:hypothetical protein